MTHNRAGNIIAILFGGVALVGVLGVAIMNNVVGPVTTTSRVTSHNVAENDLLMNAKLLVLHATRQANAGDIDGDGYIEPAPFTPVADSECGISLPSGGGCLPKNIGALMTDGWGTKHAYCVWDLGSQNTSANRLTGEASTNAYVLAVISAGPNRRFETRCGDYDGDPATNDTVINPKGEGDDIVLAYTYADAVMGSGGLWSLKDGDPETASIVKDVEIDGAFRMGFAGENDGEVGLEACTEGSHLGRMRFNPFEKAIEVCSFISSDYVWELMSGGDKIESVDGEDIAAVDGPIIAGCTLDGIEIPHGGSFLFYSQTEHNSCSSISQSRTCTNGVLGGSATYQYASCNAPADCTTGPVGTVCSDGAVYAGTYAGQRLYVEANDRPTEQPYNDGGTDFLLASAGSQSDGYANTQALRASERGGYEYYAAKECYDKGADWYLPSVSELREIQNNKVAVGGFKTPLYWSSTETTAFDSAFLVYFNNDQSAGMPVQMPKNITAWVRCVRN